MYTLYLILHVESGMVYIGQSNKLLRRWSSHKYSLKKGSHHCHHLQRAWNKYGPEAFELLVIDVDLTADQANDYELQLIEWYAELGLAYNPTWRHKGRGHMSDEAKQAQSARNKLLGIRPPSRKGAKLDPEQLEAHKQRCKNRYTNYEHKKYHCPVCGVEVKYSIRMCGPCTGQKASERLKGIIPAAAIAKSAEMRTGVNLSSKHKDKISKKLVGITPKNLAAIQQQRATEFTLIDPDGITHQGKNISQFCLDHNLHRGSINRLVKGRIQQYKKWVKG